MSSSKNIHGKRKLAAILFADIAGYTAIMQSDEKKAFIRLKRYQEVLQQSVNLHAGQIIKQYGDGSICLFDSVLDAVKCALKVQTALNTEPKVPLRLGLHLGDIKYMDDDVYGDAINVAARIESLSVPGSILMSHNIYEKVKNQEDLLIKSLGSFDFKNVEEPMLIYALTNPGIVIPNRNELAPNSTAKINNNKNIFWLIVVGVILLASLLFWHKLSSNQSTSTHSTQSINNNSLAILPFSNLSTGEENKFLSEGLHDDLLTHLSNLSDIKVISRTSVLRYRNTELPIPEIADQLNVTHIMEGSFRRIEDQIRINVQLIDANHEGHLWSEIYDRALNTDNIFNIQTEVTQKIAAALHSNLSSEQRVAIEQKPTSNLEAYESYLRGRQVMAKRNTSSLNTAKELFEKAIFLDPKFAQAYIQLGTVNYLMISYADGDADLLRNKSIKYLNEGMKLNPNLAEAYALKAIINEGQEKYKEAELAFEKSLSINPNLATTYQWYALFARDVERDRKKALSLLEQARELDPLSPAINYALGRLLFETGKFDEAKIFLKKTIEIEPSYPSSYLVLPLLYTAMDHLDSAAMIGYQNLNTNGNQGIYFEHSIFPFYFLNMNEEITSELALFRPKNRQDSLIHYRTQIQRIILYEKDYDKGLKYTKTRDFVSQLWIYHLKNDWESYIERYEAAFPRVKIKDYSFEQTGINPSWDFYIFQHYLHALHNSNRSAEALNLWDYYIDQILVNDLDMAWGQIVWKDYIMMKNACMRGEISDALKLAEKIRSHGGFGWIWRLMEVEPMLDNLRDDKEFVKIWNDWMKMIESQRTNVRSQRTEVG